MWIINFSVVTNNIDVRIYIQKKSGVRPCAHLNNCGICKNFRLQKDIARTSRPISTKVNERFNQESEGHINWIEHMEN